jgi:hypothetical protein
MGEVPGPQQGEQEKEPAVASALRWLGKCLLGRCSGAIERRDRKRAAFLRNA